MFRSLTRRLAEDIDALRRAIDVHDHARASYYSFAEGSNTVAGPVWTEVAGRDPGRREWQVYDYCAAITRLYVIYSVFVEDLASEYIQLLPTLYSDYGVLPVGVRRQHRVGAAQVLLKLGDVGPFEAIGEQDLVSTLAGAMSGNTPYSLFRTAFFVDSHRQNYRMEALARLFQALGIEQLGDRLTAHPAIMQFMRDVRGDSGTVESEIKNLVSLRNAAAHADVTDVVGSDEVHKLAEFVSVLGLSLAEIVSADAYLRRYENGELLTIGNVKETHHGGLVVIINARPVQVSVGSETVVIRPGRAAPATVESIRRLDLDLSSVLPTPGEELGLRLNLRCRVGDVLALVPTPIASAVSQPHSDTADEGELPPTELSDDSSGIPEEVNGGDAPNTPE